MGVPFIHFILITQQSPLFDMTVLFLISLHELNRVYYQYFSKSRSQNFLILRFICNFPFFIKLNECLISVTQQKCPINSRIAKLLQTFLPVWDKPVHESSQFSPTMQDQHYANFIPSCGLFHTYPNKNVRIRSNQIHDTHT